MSERIDKINNAVKALEDLEGVPITFSLHDSIKALIGYLHDELEAAEAEEAECDSGEDRSL